MKQNTISNARGRSWAVRGTVAALVVALAAGAWIGCKKLHAVWTGQCVLTDVSRQVSVTTGSNIRRELVLEKFGLTNGANLAKIDFAQKRRDLLAGVPNIRALTVSRRLPDRVEIAVEEREPVARMNERNGKRVTGRVVDADGVVFLRQDAGTALLPMLVEAQEPTKPGKRLEGRSRAALRFLLACQESAYSDLKPLAVSTSFKDFLYATLGDYTRAKVAWDGMDSQGDAAETALRAQLKVLCDARRSTPGGRQAVKIWNATLPGQAFGDTKEPIQ